MKVLMITGDKNMLVSGTAAFERAELQRSQVEELKIVYWGRGAFFIPSAKGFDVVTVQDPFWRGLAGWIAARFRGAALQIQVHTDFVQETKMNLVRYLLGQLVLAHADSVRVVSEQVKKSVQHYTHAPVSVLPVFIDVGKIQAAAPTNRSEFVQFSKLVLIAGRLEPEKNIAEGLRAFKRIIASVPNTGLLIAGTGSQQHKLHLLVRDLGVEKNVIFLGQRTDIFSLYKIADCMLVTSLFESFGASIVEALAAGCPVVSPNVGVAKEAGAIVVPREQIVLEVVRVLQSEEKGRLQLTLLSKEAWAQAWRQTLTV